MSAVYAGHSGSGASAGTASRVDRAITAGVLGAASVFFALSAYNALAASIQSTVGRRRRRQIGGKRSKSPSEDESSTDTSVGAVPPGANPSTSPSSPRPAPRPPSESAVANVTYVTTPDDCQSTIASAHRHTRPKIVAGALFKLIDVAAGVAARRHARGPCVTISVDSVVLLKPIFLGDLVHVSASVNRAWGSSMEVGVRIVKETAENGANSPALEYVSHSYLTFVAIGKPKPASTPAPSSRGWWSILTGQTSPARDEKRAQKPTLALVQPASRLESRRHMLAGRRRNKRLNDTRLGVSRDGVSIDTKRRLRQEVVGLLAEHDRRAISHTPASDEDAAQRELHIRAIEMEVLIQAWAQGEKGVAVREGVVEATQEGDDPLRFPEKEVRRHAKQLNIKIPGDDGFDPTEYHDRGMATPTWSSRTLLATPPRLAERLAKSSPLGGKPRTPIAASHSASPREALSFNFTSGALDVRQTLTTSMHLVFPQHTNSHGIIFGGNTMSWSEEVAIMACRTIRLSTGSAITWKTVTMDGLEFNVQVGVGELMIFSAVVLRTFAHSCEVYVVAQAETHEGERRFTNDVLFTMACDHEDQVKEEEGEEEEGEGEANHGHVSTCKPPIATTITMSPGSALDAFAVAGEERRHERLQLRDMLVRVYGG